MFGLDLRIFLSFPAFEIVQVQDYQPYDNVLTVEGYYFGDNPVHKVVTTRLALDILGDRHHNALDMIQKQLFESEYFSEGEFLADVLTARLERATKGAVRTIKVISKEPNPRIVIGVSNGRTHRCKWSEAMEKETLATLVLLNQGPGDE
jgi:hypothetical protein